MPYLGAALGTSVLTHTEQSGLPGQSCSQLEAIGLRSQSSRAQLVSLLLSLVSWTPHSFKNIFTACRAMRGCCFVFMKMRSPSCICMVWNTNRWTGSANRLNVHCEEAWNDLMTPWSQATWVSFTLWLLICHISFTYFLAAVCTLPLGTQLSHQFL